MKNLRIAQVAPLWTRIPPATYGGIELLMKLLIDDLVGRGHEVTLFASGDCSTAAKLHPVCDVNLTEACQRSEAYCFEYMPVRRWRRCWRARENLILSTII